MTLRQQRRFVTALAASLALFGAGCASYPANPALDTIDTESGYRFNQLSSDGGLPNLFVILTFSGGGTRAAALSYGVLEKLRDTTFEIGGVEHTLLDEVDVISSVSGGSFTSAYYGLFGDGVFQDFEERFLYENIERRLFWALFNPLNWFKLMSPTYGRIEVASEIYDDQIFQGRHFRDLSEKARRPFLMINATDVSRGARFTFVQSQFDPMCSDLDGVKVARAVAASSNFPIAFTPLTVNNYAGRCGYKAPQWMGNALKDLRNNAPRYNRAKILQSYLNAEKRPYVHLLDGGVSDNIGLRGPLVAIRSNDPPWSLLNQINNGAIDRVVVITVDAKTSPPKKMDASPSPPGLVSVVSAIATIPMENLSFDTVQELRGFFQRWNQDQVIAAEFEKLTGDPSATPKTVSLYDVYVGFDRVKNAKERRYFEELPTTFALKRKQVDRLRAIGPTLMDESESFKSLLDDLASARGG